MKITFSALHFGLFRNFACVVRALAERGHRVHLMADEPETLGGLALVEQLAAAHPTVTWGWTPSPVEAWHPFALKVRSAIDYVRFLAPRYSGVPKLRLRNVSRAPRVVRWFTAGLWRTVGTHRPLLALLRWLERQGPVSETLVGLFRKESPDVVLLASLTVSRSLAMDQFKAAHALGIPVGAAVMSWDHLSSKGLLPPDLELAIVWNDVQKREAIEMHGLRPDQISVTGAQCYDEWFTRSPRRSRQEFAQAVGLDPARPFILYVCSTMSPQPSPLEPYFVKDWIQMLRASADPTLSRAGVLIRPHPERVKEWAGVDLAGTENVVIHGRSPIDDEAKEDYFESLHYSGAVVGLCTSAFLEAAIIGRPVLTVLLPQYRMHQDGMAHFRYLRDIEGGILQMTDDVAMHLTQLSAALRSGAPRDSHERFVTAFIRPAGIDAPATPCFVEAVERLGQRSRLTLEAPLDRPFATRLVAWLSDAGDRRVVKWLLASTADEELAERWALKERAMRAHLEVKERDRARALGEKERTRQEKLRRTESQLQRRAEAKQASEARRLAQTRERARQVQRKQRTRRLREWRYRLGTAAVLVSLKRGLRHISPRSGNG